MTIQKRDNLVCCGLRADPHRAISECNLSLQVDGIWRDEIWEKDENGVERLVSRSKRKHNLITQPFTVLVARLLANDPSLIGGVLYHAIGEGDASWDTSGIPNPEWYDTQLLTELDRKTPDGIAYLKWGEGLAQSGTATMIVDPRRLESCVLVGRFEPDDFFNGMDVEIVAGTNLGEIRTVADYVQSTGQIVVTAPFPVPIDNTSQYEFIPAVSVQPTSVIEVRTTWDYGTPSDPFNFKYIREQGLFGGNADATPNSGSMIDRVTHERIYKGPTVKLIRMVDIIVRV